MHLLKKNEQLTHFKGLLVKLNAEHNFCSELTFMNWKHTVKGSEFEDKNMGNTQQKGI